MGPMGLALAIVLAAFAATHAALLAGLVRRVTWWRLAAALLVMPLAPWWGYRAGMRLRTFAWGALLVAYAISIFGVAPR